MAAVGGLDSRQQAALLAILRVVADGELVAEQMRCRLCEAQGFDPYATFKSLQGSWHSQKGWIGTYDLQRWLAGQPHNLSKASAEDVSAVLALYEMHPGELRYEGFLSMVLPTDPANAWLKETTMTRNSQGFRYPSTDGRVLPEVAYRLCLLLESEVDLSQHLKFHRNYLTELGVDQPSILRFFGSDRGISSLGGLLSQASLYRILVDRLGALSSVQCDALLRRINPAGSCLASFDELYKVLLLGSLPSTWSAKVPTQIVEPLYAEARLATPVAWKERCRELSATPPKLRPPYSHLTPQRTTDLKPGQRSDESGKDVSRDWSPCRSSLALAEPSTSCYTPVQESARFASRGELKVPDLRCPGLGLTATSTDNVRALTPSPYLPRGPLSLLPSPLRESMSPRLEDRSTFLHAVPPLSPRALRPHFEGALLGSLDSKEKVVRRVLDVMVRQASLDAQVEDAKALLPTNMGLEDIFATLDRFHKGYISDTDLSQYSQDFGGTAGFGLFVSLIHEVLLLRPREAAAIPGRLTLRELGTLVLPTASQEHEATLAATSDDELRSILYLLRFSEPCPRCSIRVQRDADSAGCPSVTCPVCGSIFRCFVVVGDFYNGASAERGPMPVAAQYHLFRLLDTAARVAHELEQARKHLQLMSGTSIEEISMLSTAFAHIADGRLSLLMGDLRRALFGQGMSISERQLGLLWRRYAPQSGVEINFSDFVRHLKPSEFRF